MPASQAHVPTDRAARYLVQLRSHTTLMSHGLLKLHGLHRPRAHSGGGGGGDGNGGGVPPEITGVEGDENLAVISFARGRCVLQATDEALVLRAEAENPQALQDIQDGVTRRLEKIGRRDRLSVAWSGTTTVQEEQDGPAGE